MMVIARRYLPLLHNGSASAADFGLAAPAGRQGSIETWMKAQRGHS